jgi:hypothetical protein
MTKPFALTLVIGLLVVGLGIWAVFYKQAGAHIEPKGSILKVRTIKLDEKTSAAVIELRIGDDSDYPLVARTIETTAVTGNGEVQGNMVAEMDVKELYKNYPALGEQFNPVLKVRDKVAPHSSIDRELCAQFMIPVEELDQRKDLIVRFEDITGATADLHEKKK